MKKNAHRSLFVMVIAMLTIVPASSFGESISWVDSFEQGKVPSTEQCQAWHAFLNQLEPDKEYLSATMGGTFAPEGLTLTEPAAVQELAYLLYSRTPGSVTAEGHTWSVFIGCNLSSCVLAGEGVELRIDQNDGCMCSSGDSNTVRPDIGLANWGGVNSSTCRSETQIMMVEFQTAAETSQTIMVGECDSGVSNIEYSNGYSVNDQIAECVDNAINHGSLVSCVSQTLNALKKQRLISGKEKGAIQECAAKAKMP